MAKWKKDGESSKPTEKDTLRQERDQGEKRGGIGGSDELTEMTTLQGLDRGKNNPPNARVPLKPSWRCVHHPRQRTIEGM